MYLLEGKHGEDGQYKADDRDHYANVRNKGEYGVYDWVDRLTFFLSRADILEIYTYILQPCIMMCVCSFNIHKLTTNTAKLVR